MAMTQKEVQKTYEEDRNSINSKDFIIGALIGGMLGAATALFVAPKAGRDLRNDITEQARVISEKTGKLRQDLTETAKEKKNNVTELVTSKSSALVGKVKSLRAEKAVEELEVEAGESEPAATSEADIASTLEEEVQIKLDEAQQAFDETEKELQS